jgi:DNA (cytosine-5)-methyltransferase 1
MSRRRSNNGTLSLLERMERRPAGALARSLKVAGLFAGIGGIELGLQRAGHHAKLLCEIDPGAVAVLEDRFPDVRVHDDICTLSRLPRDVDLIAAGFPCQDLSQAGKTAGIEGARSGLVGEVFRLVRQRRVPWILLENVPFMLQLSKGRAMEVIVATLESLGYRWAYRVVNSLAFGVPQRRERVFLLASLEEDPRDVLFADEVPEPEPPIRRQRIACGFYWTEGVRGLGWAVDAVPTLKGGSTVGIPSPPAILMPDGRIVTPHINDAERMQGFRSGWTEPAAQVTRATHRWKLVGNAVTVDAAEWIGRNLASPRIDAGRRDGVRLESGAPWPRAAWNIGQGRMTTAMSSWPVQRERAPLHEFLRYPPKLLSPKATAGFLGRTESAKLRFPTGFLARVAAHLERVTTSQPLHA